MATMDRRLKLHSIFIDILGSENVYFQTPENFSMEYPCVRYERANDRIRHANDSNYLVRKQYNVTVIYEDPDSDLPDKFIEGLPPISEPRYFKSDNLNHCAFSIFF